MFFWKNAKVFFIVQFFFLFEQEFFQKYAKCFFFLNVFFRPTSLDFEFF